MRRTLGASLLPAVAITAAWLTTESPGLWESAFAVAALAVATALPRRWWARIGGLAAASVGVVAAVADVGPSAVVRRDDVLEPVVRTLSNGIGDFYGVVLPFDPAGREDMHAVVVLAVFGFVAATSHLVAARRPLGAAAVTIVAVGWPATLTETDTVLLGALGLAAVLSLLISLRVGSARGAVVSVAAASALVLGAAWISSAAAISQTPAVDWRSWDFRGVPASALGVRFVWNASYGGISFPPTRTLVLEIEGPERAQYWRVSTLDSFAGDAWAEELYPQRVGPTDGDLAQDELMPLRARNRDLWLEQRVSVKALVDNRLAASGTPVSVSAESLGPIFQLSNGILRAQRSIRSGSYRIWSFAPDPSPSALERAPARYPAAAERFLGFASTTLPAFGEAGRDEEVRAILSDPDQPWLAPYELLYDEARRVTAGAGTPYAAVLALERWFRSGGGFRYEERTRPSWEVPPLVEFVTRTRAGYCQHFAGAMAVMLRLVGVPARVAVGFTSGQRDGDVWKVTDHEAHAWVEVWFPGQGWVAFDPTPGRGTLSGVYSFASESAQAVAALGRGDLDAVGTETGRGITGRRVGDLATTPGDNRPSLAGLAALIGIAGAVGIGLVKWVTRRARYLSRDPRRLAAASRRELEDYLRDQGVAISPGATLDDLQRAVFDEAGADGRAFAEAGRARFGRPGHEGRDAAAARRELRSLLRSIRGSLSTWRRLRGFVSLRSLLGGSA